MKINHKDLTHVMAQITRNYITSDYFHLDESEDIIIVDTPKDLHKFVFDIFKELHIDIEQKGE